MNRKSIFKATLLGTTFVCGAILVSQQSVVNASQWKANSPESIQIVKGQKEYVVKEGDTLWAISIKTNIKVETLAKASGIKDPNVIYVGQKIILDGDTLTVKDSNNHVVSVTPLTDADKVNPNQDFGEKVTILPNNSLINSNNVFKAKNTEKAQASTKPVETKPEVSKPATTPVKNTEKAQTSAKPVETKPETSTSVATPAKNTEKAQASTKPVETKPEVSKPATTPAKNTEKAEPSTKPVETKPETSTSVATPTKNTEKVQASTKPVETKPETSTPASTQQETTLPDYYSTPGDIYSDLNEKGLSLAEQGFVSQINKYRASLGLNPLTMTEAMQESAHIRGAENQKNFVENGDVDNGVRPDGSWGYTSIPDYQNRLVGENSGIVYTKTNDGLDLPENTPQNVANEVSEVVLENSHGKYENPDFKYVGVSINPAHNVEEDDNGYTFVAQLSN